MGAYSVQISTRLDFSVGDKPQILGTIKDGTDLVGNDQIAILTIRSLNSADKTILAESAVSVNSLDWSFVWPAAFTEQVGDRGQLLISVLPRLSGTFVLNGLISTGVLSADLTISDGGEIPSSGWCLIEDEVCAFTRVDSDTISLTTRGVFETTDVGHADGVAVIISEAKNTLESPYPIDIRFDVNRVFDL